MAISRIQTHESGGCENSRVVCDEQMHACMCVCSAAKAVQRATLTLQRVHDVHRRDGLATCVFRVRDSITNHVLQEHLEHSARLLVNEVRDALHAATTSETTNKNKMNYIANNDGDNDSWSGCQHTLVHDLFARESENEVREMTTFHAQRQQQQQQRREDGSDY